MFLWAVVGGADACRRGCLSGVGVLVPRRADCARLRGGAGGHRGRAVAHRGTRTEVSPA